ncbi:MAG: division/cell wall cluster transcriptional repressor MraZ [Deltaproteobacteria bacterium]|jgi:MraZ protein|nr:division/cell wall cluster transcriptional repressor MraZ [Deltaproteobacteria bacterium]
MFRGRSKHTLDEKGRLAIPARFKETLKLKEESCLVVTNYLKCLWAFSKEEWTIIEEKAASLSLMNNAVNTYRRYFISGAQECPVKQGRILIPPDLREIAGLKKEVVLVGELKLFEIWDQERWEGEFQKAMENFPEASQSLSELGI